VGACGGDKSIGEVGDVVLSELQPVSETDSAPSIRAAIR
jgi:hypothetical protein